MLKGYPISSILQMKPGTEGSINCHYYLINQQIVAKRCIALPYLPAAHDEFSGTAWLYRLDQPPWKTFRER
jgi:hypothetical protein